MVYLHVIGSAAGGGFPQWNCNHPNSRRARAGDPAARPRTQSSLAASADGKRWFLFNASPDLRQQINDNAILHPKDGVRDSPIRGVVLTNADVDHVAGLLTLRESQPFRLYATPKVHGVLRANPIFNVLNPEYVARETLPLGHPIDLRLTDGTPSGLQVEAFPVPGKIALYMEDPSAGPNFGTTEEDTIGLALSSSESDATCYYVPGCARLDDVLAERVRGAACLFFDGTFWRDDEMIVSGTGMKTGARMGHMSLSGESGTIAAFERLGVKRKIFIHINCTNPILLEDSPERAVALDAGWEVSYDGMEVRL